MKICKQCNAAQSDEARFCNLCGAALEDEIVEETAAEDVSEEVTEAGSEELTEELTEEPVEEPAEETKKKTPWGWIIGLAAAVVLVVALILIKGNAGSAKGVDLNAALHTNAYGLESYSVHFEKAEDGTVAYSYMNEAAETVPVDEKSVEGMMDQVVASTGIMELTNRDLQYYYEQQYYYFYSMYSSYLSYVMDASKGLDEQEDMYGSGTWQNYFMNASVDMFHQVAALYQAATEKGFMPTAEQQAQMDQSLDLATAAANYGYDDVDLFMKDYIGPFATVESYQNFMRMNMIASYYASAMLEDVTVDDAELEAYYDANAETIQGNYGIQKIDKNVVNVRHILIKAEPAEDGTITEETWAAAEAEAQRIYDEWLSGAATEETFAEAATTYSVDGGSNTNGGLYTDVYPGWSVPAFNEWCFADGREVGDTGIVRVEASNYCGYHIIYFSGEGDYVYWKMAVEEMVATEKAAEVRNAIVDGYALESDLTKAVVLDAAAPTAPAAEEAVEGETAE